MSVEPLQTWTHDVLAHYELALWTGTTWQVAENDGDQLPFDVRRWSAEPDAADETVLARCLGPTLDIGCGPGRFVAALAARGTPALGVDVAGAAVAITRAGGGLALRRSVFDPLPGAGRWTVALLADGNVGIGGDAGALLSRVREILAPGGRVLVEVEEHDVDVAVIATVSDHAGTVQASFPWLRIGARPLLAIAESCGLVSVDQWDHSGRRFLSLQRD
ncbi:MAG: methyltransferase domain-containing protein [Sporichthyaceae bacterium]